jgi:hypothetical protein
VIYCCAAYWEHRHVQQHLACWPASRPAADPLVREAA